MRFGRSDPNKNTNQGCEVLDRVLLNVLDRVLLGKFEPITGPSVRPVWPRLGSARLGLARLGSFSFLVALLDVAIPKLQSSKAE